LNTFLPRMKHNFEIATVWSSFPMPAPDRRVVLAVVLSAAVVSSVVAWTILWVQRASAQISVTDVGLVSDSPQSGMTEVQARLVLKNVGRSVVHFEFLTLFAYAPGNGTLFDTFSHTKVQLNPGETQAFSETTSVTGHWSEIAFTVKIFLSGAPTWERSLVPDQPVTWNAS